MKIFSKLAAWFHRHPGIKRTAVVVGSGAVNAAALGVFGPKAAAAAAIVGAVTGGAMHEAKAPADVTPGDKSGLTLGDSFRSKDDASGKVYRVKYVGKFFVAGEAEDGAPIEIPFDQAVEV